MFHSGIIHSVFDVNLWCLQDNGMTDCAAKTLVYIHHRGMVIAVLLQKKTLGGELPPLPAF